LDKVHIYQFDAERGNITPAQPAFVSIAPGAGPRHMVFGRDGRFAYVLNELNATITVFNFDAATGQLRELETVATLPDDFGGENLTSEIEVHPSGKFLYTSNRGHDSVALFAIELLRGTLHRVAFQATGGKTPRHFAIDPSGKLLLIGNEDSDSLMLCKIDQETGGLEPSPTLVETPVPVCMKFLPLASTD
jgi:6-phosphogluconolactonase